MARPRSENKRQTILAAATDLFAAEGLNASTAKIAKSAGVSEGTIFVYFPSKDDLINQLYLELKSQLHASLRESPIADAESLRNQLWCAWKSYVDWGVAYPQKHQTLAALTLSSRVSDETRGEAHKTFCDVSDMLDLAIKQGALQHQQGSFAGTLMAAMGDATMTYIRSEPVSTAGACEDGFTAFWNAITGK